MIINSLTNKEKETAKKNLNPFCENDWEMKVEKELEEIEELLLDTELQIKLMEEQINDIEELLQQLDKDLILFEKESLPRLIGYK